MPRKGENIFQRKDGRWEARYIHHYENGRAKYRYIYASTYAEAKARRVKDQKKDPVRRKRVPGKAGSFRTISGQWLDTIRMTVRESTYTRYYRIVEKYLAPRFGDQLIARIDQRRLKLLPEELLRRGGMRGNRLSAKTVSDIVCVLKAILRYARQCGYMVPDAEAVRCPAKSAQMVGIMPEKHRVRIEQMALESGDPTALGILLALFTGVRIGELCGLRWSDIDFRESTVSIQRTVERISDLDLASGRKTKVIVSVPKTENSLRIIPIPRFLTRSLKKYSYMADSYILTGQEIPTEPHQYYIRYRKFLKRNSIEDYSFHTLRHTFATRCVEAGFDPKALSEILGHANVTTTLSVYVHPTLRQKRAQMERLTPEYLEQAGKLPEIQVKNNTDPVCQIQESVLSLVKI